MILVTTLETNRDEGYRKVSPTAPLPTDRYEQFRALHYGRKVVTVEPALDFDVKVFSEWIIDLDPEYVWLGFNSHPKSVALAEPPESKMKALMAKLSANGIKVKGKDLRGIEA